MSAIERDGIGLSLRDLVLEIRSDLKTVTKDHNARLEQLENDGIHTKAVAKTLLSTKSETLTKREKFIALVFAAVTVIMNFLALGPDIFNF